MPLDPTQIRLLRVERRLMEAEYLIDSTNTHVLRKKCGDVRPLSLRRYSNALNAIRSALALVRHEQGARHPTLFAGKSGKGKAKVDRGQKQKSWGSDRPHVWRKDCEGIPVDNGPGYPSGRRFGKESPPPPKNSPHPDDMETLK